MSIYKMLGDVATLTDKGLQIARNQTRIIRADSSAQALALFRHAFLGAASIVAVSPNTASDQIGSAHAYDAIVSPTSGAYVSALETRGIKHTAAYTARHESWAFKNAEKGKDKAIGKLMRIKA